MRKTHELTLYCLYDHTGIRRHQQDDGKKSAVLLKRNQKVMKHNVTENSCEDDPMLNLKKKQLEDQGGQLERVVVL